jgi:hypothetical protein
MSNATIESPVAASQLFFTWFEQSAVGVAPTKKPKSKALAPASAAPKAPVSASVPVAASSPAPSAAVSAAASTAASAVVKDPAPQNHLSFTSDGRIAHPVRIGSVMIKLLKRYGITDAEIAEGVANYARKHQTAVAS